MEKNNNYNLAGMNSIFNNKTLTYRINGFASACNMNDLEIPDNRVSNQVLFSSRKSDTSYYIVVNNSDSNALGEGTTISGYYDDLNFSFSNYYKLDKNLERKVLELPFNIELYKTVDKDTYHLEIETVNGIRTKFLITKSREYKDKTISSNVKFYANVLEFSSILKLVKSFVYNPKLVFATYNEIMDKKKIVLTNTDLNKAVMQDASLDKPVGKIKRKIKKIIG